MKTGRTLQELAVELDRQRMSKRDFVVNTTAMKMEPDAQRFNLLKPDETEGFDMSGLFHRQLGSTLGIPSRYYDKMQGEYPELLSQNVNGWFQRAAPKGKLKNQYPKISHLQCNEVKLIQLF